MILCSECTSAINLVICYWTLVCTELQFGCTMFCFYFPRPFGEEKTSHKLKKGLLIRLERQYWSVLGSSADDISSCFRVEQAVLTLMFRSDSAHSFSAEMLRRLRGTDCAASAFSMTYKWMPLAHTRLPPRRLLVSHSYHNIHNGECPNALITFSTRRC